MDQLNGLVKNLKRANLLVIGGLLHQVQDLGGEGGIGQWVGLRVDFSFSGLKEKLNLLKADTF